MNKIKKWVSENKEFIAYEAGLILGATAVIVGSHIGVRMYWKRHGGVELGKRVNDITSNFKGIHTWVPCVEGYIDPDKFLSDVIKDMIKNDRITVKDQIKGVIITTK